MKLTRKQQTIYQNMIQIAATYVAPHRERYVKAANEFRLPYLDYFRARDDRGVRFPGPNGDQWFKYDFRLPDVFNEPRINAKLPPLDKIEEIDNPLYTYKFTRASGQLQRDDWDLVGITALGWRQLTDLVTLAGEPRPKSPLLNRPDLALAHNRLPDRTQPGCPPHLAQPE